MASMTKILVLFLGLSLLSGCDSEHSKQAKWKKLGVPDDPNAPYEAPLGNTVVRIPKVSMIYDINFSVLEPGKLGSITLMRLPWPPESSLDEKERLYLTVKFGNWHEPRTPLEDLNANWGRLSYIAEQQNWANSGYRRLIPLRSEFSDRTRYTKIYVAEDTGLVAKCRRYTDKAYRDCTTKNRELLASDRADFDRACGPQLAAQLVTETEPGDSLCEVRSEAENGLRIDYDFPEKYLLEWEKIEQHIREYISSFVVSST